jgi:hypothetical protein
MLWKEDACCVEPEVEVEGGVAVGGGANAVWRADIRASTVSMLTAGYSAAL